MLSLHSVVSTTSSAAQRHTQAQEQGVKAFTKIGAGACGAVFAQDGQSLVIKLAKGDSKALWNDYTMHANIASKFARYVIDEVRVPACYFFVPPETTSYFDSYPNLVQAAEQLVNFPTAALVSERILPLPHGTRISLIEKYCSPRNRQNALADRANKDCLVRLYLGSMQGKTGGMFFSLRNFKLHLNHMVDLGLDVEALARRMGTSFALMHWAAKTDGRDVEFVLGSSAKKTPVGLPVDEIMALQEPTYTGPPSCVNEDFFTRTTEMWLLDFNQVQTITLDDAGVAMAVEAVKLNDPYVPKPLRKSTVERRIWKAFVISYLHASDIVLEEEGTGRELLELPRKFIAGITELERERIQRREA
ncbi:Pre-mRNA splicing factor ATP-dependent RNA helicase PRP43 [Coniochaeta hoffmannii]|uniref:Pre-mRNA splicing factor ATP-dependent RNA helicase PRP43 n=1 Tax=Coniochaeta hoffmannii TaxID=91930 RepID=A0AA38RY29_9PEZI|nr:Pre-mRNA splicing factor ATP-dependent RNA helicase PRP43 [Coniochaeta hoffmannii]